MASCSKLRTTDPIRKSAAYPPPHPLSNHSFYVVRRTVMERTTKLGANAILIALSVAFGLILSELLVRLLLPIYPSGRLTVHQLPDGTQIGPPGTVLRQVTDEYDVEAHFNEWGFRDEKDLTTATQEALYVVGDSFAFGWGVRSRDRISDYLETNLGRPVFNIANFGTNLDGYLRLIHYAEKNGAAVKNLVISVTMENDLGVYAK